MLWRYGWRIVALWGIFTAAVIVGLWLGRALPPPDMIAFERYHRLPVRSPGVSLLDMRAGVSLPITDIGRDGFNPHWSPDSGSLIYNNTVYRYSRWSLLPPYKTEALAWFDGGMTVSGLDWSPNGCCIAYSTQNDRGDGYEIRVLHLETGQRWAIVDSVVLSQTNPRWSPDGKTIAFMGYLISSGRPPRIYTVAVHTDDLSLTTPPRRIPDVVTDGFEGYANPVWSPEGTHIYFSRGAQMQLARVRVDGTIKLPEAFEMIDGIQTPDPISFSPDGRRFVYVARTDPVDRYSQTRLFIADRDGNNPRRVTYSGNPNFLDGNPVWRP